MKTTRKRRTRSIRNCTEIFNLAVESAPKELSAVLPKEPMHLSYAFVFMLGIFAGELKAQGVWKLDGRMIQASFIPDCPDAFRLRL